MSETGTVRFKKLLADNLWMFGEGKIVMHCVNVVEGSLLGFRRVDDGHKPGDFVERSAEEIQAQMEQSELVFQFLNLEGLDALIDTLQDIRNSKWLVSKEDE